MLVRVVTLRFDPLFEALHEAPLQDSLKGGEALAIRGLAGKISRLSESGS